MKLTTNDDSSHIKEGLLIMAISLTFGNTKLCHTCKEMKDRSFFGKNTSCKDGLRSSCKVCSKIKYKLCIKKNPDKYKELHRKTNRNYEKKLKDTGISRHMRNRESNNLKHKEYYHKNKNNVDFKQYRVDYYQKTKHIANEKRKTANKKRRQTDILYAMKERIRNRMRSAHKSKNFYKNQSFIEYIGCDKETLLNYLESKFVDGMNWENRNLWEIDHIVPLSSAKTIKGMIQLAHYTNLQPLWTKDNKRKSNKLIFELKV